MALPKPKDLGALQTPPPEALQDKECEQSPGLAQRMKIWLDAPSRWRRILLHACYGREFNPNQRLWRDIRQFLGIPGQVYLALYHALRHHGIPRSIEKFKTPLNPEKETLRRDQAAWDNFLAPSDDPNLESFVYEPLQYLAVCPSIRLVELLPGKGLDEIECRLRPALLNSQSPRIVEKRQMDDQAPGGNQDSAYRALSYYWGDPTVKSHIRCNGTRLAVTKNLKAALYHLRDEHWSTVLWIDAICINQQDNEERSTQVGFMRDIYSGAQSVIVWLGESAENSELAFAYCKRLVTEYKDVDLDLAEITSGTLWAKKAKARRAADALMTEDASSSTSSSIKNGQGASTKTEVDKEQRLINVSSQESDREASEMQEQNSPDSAQSQIPIDVNGTNYTDKRSIEVPETEILAFHRLLKRPWFKRMWIAQEIALAREAIVCCGESSIDWDYFHQAFTINTLFATQGQEGRPEYIFHGMSQVAFLRQLCSGTDETNDLALLKLLTGFRSFQATDSRDKVFALYGLTSTNLEVLQLRPDYTTTAEEIYQRVAVALLQASTNLELLSLPQSTTELSRKLPSWVPDWSQESPKISLIRQGFSKMTPIQPSKFHASNTSLLPPIQILNEGTLSLSGYTFDTITQIRAAYTVPEIDFIQRQILTKGRISLIDASKRVWEFWSYIVAGLDTHLTWETLALRHQRRASYITGESHLTAYQRTLCADFILDDPETAREAFQRWRRIFPGLRILRFFGLAGFPGFYNIAVLLWMYVMQRFCGFDRDWANMMECTLQRRMARTQKGYLALVPEEAGVGDGIVLCRGGDLPLVVRRVERGWRLLGDGYVHGIMYGEAWEEGLCGEILLV